MKEAGLQALQKQLVEEAEGAEKAASAVSKVRNEEYFSSKQFRHTFLKIGGPR